MTQHADTSGSLALSPQPQEPPRPVPKGLDSRRTLRTAAILDPASAEIAQARIFERLLQDERTELLELSRTAGETPDPDNASTGDLTQIRARLDEIHRLLRALRGRFPGSAPKGAVS
jgi:hypothetical protein